MTETKNYIVSSVEELRLAIKQKGSRKITFGYFERHPDAITPLGFILYVKDHQDLVIENDDLEIDGRANLPIMIYGARLHIKKAKNITLRNLQIRLGATDLMATKKGVENDTLTIISAKNVLISHCSLSWSIDETLSIVDSKNVTVEWSIISEPLNKPRDKNGDKLHSEGNSHGYGCLIRGSKRVLLDHCLFCHCLKRCPSISPDGKNKQYDTSVQVINCLIYDYREHGSGFNAGGKKTKNKITFNLINNLYRPRLHDHGPEINLETPNKKAKLKLFQVGNYQDRGNSRFRPATINYEKSDNEGKIKENDKYRLDLSVQAWHEASHLLEIILDNVGVTHTKRNMIDNRIIGQVKKRTGELIDHEDQTPEFNYLKPFIKG